MKTSDNLEKIKEFLEIIKHKIDMVETNQTSQSASIGLMKDQLSIINKKMDSHSAALVTIESTLTAYADMYKINDK